MDTPSTPDLGALARLDDEAIIDLFMYACEYEDDHAADALQAEIERRGIYGRKPAREQA